MGCGAHVGGLWRPFMVDLEPAIAPAHPTAAVLVGVNDVTDLTAGPSAAASAVIPRGR